MHKLNGFDYELPSKLKSVTSAIYCESCSMLQPFYVIVLSQQKTDHEYFIASVASAIVFVGWCLCVIIGSISSLRAFHYRSGAAGVHVQASCCVQCPLHTRRLWRHQWIAVSGRMNADASTVTSEHVLTGISTIKLKTRTSWCRHHKFTIHGEQRNQNKKVLANPRTMHLDACVTTLALVRNQDVIGQQPISCVMTVGFRFSIRCTSMRTVVAVVTAPADRTTHPDCRCVVIDHLVTVEVRFRVHVPCRATLVRLVLLAWRHVRTCRRLTVAYLLVSVIATQVCSPTREPLRPAIAIDAIATTAAPCVLSGNVAHVSEIYWLNNDLIVEVIMSGPIRLHVFYFPIVTKEHNIALKSITLYMWYLVQ